MALRRGALILSLLAVLGCSREDPGARAYEAAIAEYTALLEAGKLPADPAFDAVLARLAQVPGDGPSRKKADSLAAAIVRSRGQLPRRPLAREAGESDLPQIAAERKKCEAAARAVGEASEADRPAKVTALRECQQKLERLLARHLDDRRPDAGLVEHDHAH